MHDMPCNGIAPPQVVTCEYSGQACRWCPWPDIFNHKAAVVALAGNYQIEPNCFGDDSSRDSASDTASASGEGSLAS